MSDSNMDIEEEEYEGLRMPGEPGGPVISSAATEEPRSESPWSPSYCPVSPSKEESRIAEEEKEEEQLSIEGTRRIEKNGVIELWSVESILGHKWTLSQAKEYFHVVDQDVIASKIGMRGWKRNAGVWFGIDDTNAVPLSTRVVVQLQMSHPGIFGDDVQFEPTRMPVLFVEDHKQEEYDFYVLLVFHLLPRGSKVQLRTPWGYPIHNSHWDMILNHSYTLEMEGKFVRLFRTMLNARIFPEKRENGEKVLPPTLRYLMSKATAFDAGQCSWVSRRSCTTHEVFRTLGIANHAYLGRLIVNTTDSEMIGFLYNRKTGVDVPFVLSVLSFPSVSSVPSVPSFQSIPSEYFRENESLQSRPIMEGQSYNQRMAEMDNFAERRSVITLSGSNLSKYFERIGQRMEEINAEYPGTFWQSISGQAGRCFYLPVFVTDDNRYSEDKLNMEGMIIFDTQKKTMEIAMVSIDEMFNDMNVSGYRKIMYSIFKYKNTTDSFAYDIWHGYPFSEWIMVYTYWRLLRPEYTYAHIMNVIISVDGILSKLVHGFCNVRSQICQESEKKRQEWQEGFRLSALLQYRQERKGGVVLPSDDDEMEIIYFDLQTKKAGISTIPKTVLAARFRKALERGMWPMSHRGAIVGKRFLTVCDPELGRWFLSNPVDIPRVDIFEFQHVFGLLQDWFTYMRGSDFENNPLLGFPPLTVPEKDRLLQILQVEEWISLFSKDGAMWKAAQEEDKRTEAKKAAGDVILNEFDSSYTSMMEWFLDFAKILREYDHKYVWKGQGFFDLQKKIQTLRKRRGEQSRAMAKYPRFNL